MDIILKSTPSPIHLSWVGVLLVSVIAGGVCLNGYADELATLNFSGKITQAGCTISSSSDLTVALGDWFATDFSGVGSTTAKQAVPVTLDCAAGAKITATIQADTDDPQSGTINVTSSGSGTAASGVGVQLVNASSVPLVLNSSFVVTDSAPDGAYSLGWYARYIQTGSEIAGGPANALAVLTLSYQ